MAKYLGCKTKNWILWSSKEILSGLEMNRVTQEIKKNNLALTNKNPEL